MLSLTPSELWDYRFSDALRGLAIHMNPEYSNSSLLIQGLGRCLPTRSARSAIIIALKALRLKPGSAIGVPLYCCPVVFKAIQMAGFRAVFLDIDPKTYCISPEDLAVKHSRIEALIAVHMFGNVCEIRRLQDIMGDRPIIEDCAQSLGSRLNGQLTGSFGRISFFSFRSGKYLSVGEGGALYSPHNIIGTRMEELIFQMPTPSMTEEFLHVAKTYLRSRLRSKPLWGLLGNQIWSLYNKKVDFASKSPIVQEKSFRSDLSIIRDRLLHLDSMIELQRANAEYYARNLDMDSSMFCIEIPGSFYNRYIFPIIFPSSAVRDRIAEYLSGRRFNTSKPYEGVDEGAAAHYGYAYDCPQTEDVSRRILAIPVHYRLQPRDVTYIVESLNRIWGKIA
jgi:perosamine synthetase